MTAAAVKLPSCRLSEADLRFWVRTAARGERVIYNSGAYAGEGAATTAALALRLAEAGQLHLLQRRLGEGRFDYIAVRR